MLRLLGASALAPIAGGCAPIAVGATYDEVLDAIHRTDVMVGGGVSSHAPMAAEALVALGHDARVAPFVTEYLMGWPPFQEVAPLPSGERGSSLGVADQRFAWIAAYLEETASPAELVTRDWAVLAPGWAAVHGVLRVAHALRALEREDTPSRRHELAFGLGYLAADALALPGEPGARAEAGLDVVAALERVPRVPEAERVTGTIRAQLAVLEGRADFASAVEAVDLDALPVDEAIGALTAAAARVFARDGAFDVVLFHAITGTSALRLVRSYLGEADARASLGWAFRHVAAAHAVAAAADGIPSTVPAATFDLARLVDRASRTSDEHVVKLTEVAAREGSADVLSAASRFLGF